MPKRKKGKKPLQPHQESAAASEDLPDPHQHPQIMAEAETLTHSPQIEADPAPLQQSPPQGEGGGEAQDQAEPQAIAASDASAVPDVLVAPQIPAIPDPPPSARKAPGKRKKPISSKKLNAIEEKLTLLHQNLRPIPFAPGRAPDFPRHERLFRALGLWDFAHLDLGADPLRLELLIPLIAHYDQSLRRSDVLGSRISVNRADLARALALPLPLKKDKAAPSEDDLTLFSGEEATTVITDFISNWMVFLEDACVLPVEVVSATKLVKEGQPHKVDWAGLVWTMVEKELHESPKSGQCYYASHLQRLIMHQRPELFEAEAEPDMEPEPSTEVAPAEEEDDTGNGDGAMMTATIEVFQEAKPDNQGPGLSLGLGTEVDEMLGLEDCKGGEEQHWFTGREDAVTSHCLQRCSFSDVADMECEDMGKDGEDKGGRAEDSFDDELAARFPPLERLTSTDLLQAMESGNVSYNMQVHPLDPTSGEFLAMGTETHKNMEIDPGPESSFLFGNSCKREIDEIEDDDNGNDMHQLAHGNDMHQLAHGNQQKRMQSDGPWEHTTSETSAFDTCMEQVQCWMGKAKMVLVEKEQACANSQLEMHYMSNLLQQKDQIIRSLERASMEEAQKRELEVSRFEHELRILTHVIYGYKKALNETRSAFAEYRKQFPQGDEPLYKDVGGAGGIVLSTRELERQWLEKQEQMHRAAAEAVNDFERGWVAKFTGYEELVSKLTIKLVELHERFKLIKERFEKAKVSEAIVE